MTLHRCGLGMKDLHGWKRRMGGVWIWHLYYQIVAKGGDETPFEGQILFLVRGWTTANDSYFKAKSYRISM